MSEFTKAFYDAALSTARAEATAAERARVNAILTSDAASERPSIAKSLALNTDMSPEAAETFIADLPAEGRARFSILRGGLGDLARRPAAGPASL